MSAFYPNVPRPWPNVPADAVAMRTVRKSRSGKTHGGGTSGKLDPGGLAEWEGVTTFRDARSPTGWIDMLGHVIAAVDTHGVVLLPRRTDGKLSYYEGPSSRGGNFFEENIGKALGIVGGDLLGLGLSVSGKEDLNTARVQAGTGIALGMLGGAAIGSGAQAAEGSGTMKFSDIFATDQGSKLPDWLKSVGGYADTAIDIYGQLKGGSEPAPQPMTQSPQPIATPAQVAGGSALIYIGAALAAYFLLFRRR